MGFLRGIGDSHHGGQDPIVTVGGALEEQRRVTRSGRLCGGTLACARCDAPVALAAGPHPVTERLTCPFCGQRGPLRDFLSLSAPTRPARVEVRVAVSPVLRSRTSVA